MSKITGISFNELGKFDIHKFLMVYTEIKNKNNG